MTDTIIPVEISLDQLKQLNQNLIDRGVELFEDLAITIDTLGRLTEISKRQAIVLEIDDEIHAAHLRNIDHADVEGGRFVGWLYSDFILVTVGPVSKITFPLQESVIIPRTPYNDSWI